MRNWRPILLAGLVLGAGCAGRSPFAKSPAPTFNDAATGAPSSPQPAQKSKVESAKTSELIVTPENAVAGKVVRYNDAGRFVVLDFPLGRTPALEQRLFLYRRGLKVGEIKITGPQIENHIVADLTTGEAQPGDEVRNK
jgi:hypothetical protein